MKLQKIYTVYILIIFATLIFVVSGVYYYYTRDQRTGDKMEMLQSGDEKDNSLMLPGKDDRGTESVTTKRTEEGVGEVDEGGLEGKIRIQAEITETVDCGDKDCFEEKFSACEPATVEADAGALGSTYYEIIEPTSDGCRVTMKYTHNPNPDWIDKEMTCTFDNTLTVSEAAAKAVDSVFQGTGDCRGPLVNVLQALTSGR